MSSNDPWIEVIEKLWEYLEIHVWLAWAADPRSRSVHADRVLTNVREFAEEDMPPGDDVLPEFTMSSA